MAIARDSGRVGHTVLAAARRRAVLAKVRRVAVVAVGAAPGREARGAVAGAVDPGRVGDAVLAGAGRRAVGAKVTGAGASRAMAVSFDPGRVGEAVRGAAGARFGAVGPKVRRIAVAAVGPRPAGGARWLALASARCAAAASTVAIAGLVAVGAEVGCVAVGALGRRVPACGAAAARRVGAVRRRRRWAIDDSVQPIRHSWALSEFFCVQTPRRLRRIAIAKQVCENTRACLLKSPHGFLALRCVQPRPLAFDIGGEGRVQRLDVGRQRLGGRGRVVGSAVGCFEPSGTALIDTAHGAPAAACGHKARDHEQHARWRRDQSHSAHRREKAVSPHDSASPPDTCRWIS